MKELLFLFMVFGYVPILVAQNLVPNGNFERANICVKYQEKCTPLGWRATTMKLFGYHIEERAGHYIKLLLYDQSRDNDRKLAQTELICPMEKGQEYRLSLKIKPNQFWINQINIGFSSSMILSRKVNLDDVNFPVVSLELPTNIKENQWYLIETTYIANGSEKYLFLGNLLKDALTKVTAIDKKKDKNHRKEYRPKMKVQYGFDDLQIVKADGDQSLCDNASAKQTKIFNYHTRHSLLGPTSLKIDTTSKDSIHIDAPEPPTIVEVAKEDNLSIKRTPAKIILSNLLFEYNESALRSVELQELNKIATLMESSPNLKARILGFTDSKGNKIYNMELSHQRALAVRDYLIIKNISTDRLLAIGRGETNPITSNMTEQGRSKNRRVEVEFYY